MLKLFASAISFGKLFHVSIMDIFIRIIIIIICIKIEYLKLFKVVDVEFETVVSS